MTAARHPSSGRKGKEGLVGSSRHQMAPNCTTGGGGEADERHAVTPECRMQTHVHGQEAAESIDPSLLGPPRQQQQQLPTGLLSSEKRAEALLDASHFLFISRAFSFYRRGRGGGKRKNRVA